MRTELIAWLDAAPLGTRLKLESSTVQRTAKGWGESLSSEDLILRLKGVLPARTEGHEWVTRDGRRIKIADMSDDHLVNTCKHLRRALIEKAEMGGHTPYEDHAVTLRNPAEFMHIYAQRLPHHRPQGQIENLVAEVQKRGLDGKFDEESFITDLAKRP